MFLLEIPQGGYWGWRKDVLDISLTPNTAVLTEKGKLDISRQHQIRDRGLRWEGQRSEQRQREGWRRHWLGAPGCLCRW